ncbi:MAG: AAA family ATPase [Coriobacteriales bacterium]|jgi:chromosome segregation protein|nr:AAA family ATPase [Coriobacteriales bacterium]
MYLKSLTIKGFKSFADRSVISFEPGISVIVGPNGSGKSNISEAIMWVLGEINPRNLRVQSLEELIFSGSSARQAVSVAEVELVLDNTDKTLAIEFDQVSLSRRMYRSGESEYFINKTPSRRRDIIDILYDSGMGGTGNSIISQGNLTTILESRPEDRHALLEDAAGVLKHKKRKQAATRKLDRMDVTLERVKDIIKLVDSQLRPLELQARRAEQYSQTRDELKNIDLSLAVDELRALQTQWNQHSRELQEIDAEAELANFRLQEREAELSKRQVALQEKGLFVGDINEQRIRVLAIIQRLDAGMLLLEEKGKNLVARLSDLRATIHNSRSRLSVAEAEQEELSLESSRAEGRLAAVYSSYNELMKESEHLTRLRRQAEEEHSGLSARLRSQQIALETTRQNLSRATDSLASLDVEERLLREREQELDAEVAAHQELLDTSSTEEDELKNELLKLTRSSDLAKAEVDKFVRLLEERRHRLEHQNTELNERRAQLRGLEETERAQVSAAPALSWALHNQAKLEGIIGPLADRIKIRDNAKLPFDLDIIAAEGILERLLGVDYFGLLVKDNDTALQLAQRLQKQIAAQEAAKADKADGDTESEPDLSRGALSIVPAAGMRAHSRHSKRGHRLLDLLDYPPVADEAIAALLGDVYLAADIRQAQRYHLLDKDNTRFVTPDGQIIWPNGKITIGFAADDLEGVLQRRRSIARLSDELELLLAKVSDRELEVSDAEQNLTRAQEASLEIASQLVQCQGKTQSLAAELTRLRTTGEQLGLRLEANKRKLADVGRRHNAAAPLASEYHERIERLESDIVDLQGRVEHSAQALLVTNEDKNTLAERLTEAKIDLESNKGAQTHLRNRLIQLKATIQSQKNILAVSEQTAASLSLIRLRIDPLYKLYQELHVGAGVWAQRLHDQAHLQQTDSSNLRKVIDEANRAARDARDELNAITERRTAVLVEQGKLESRVQAAMQRITQEHQTALEAALELPVLKGRQQAEERANRLRAKIAGMGAINQVATEEYARLRERRDYMDAQVADLLSARKSLAKISQALDRKMRNQFLETFGAVNNSFQEIITILFPGGKGELILTQGDRDDDNGIEVSAQPAGKRIQKLSMMSGGEKSLVALALLFALYNIRRIPFYVLDEVEAALDDTNLVRLLDYLNHLRQYTQLILVSHQRRTMECADVLYGVTMQAAGVSVLVSQRLDQALGYASRSVIEREEGTAYFDRGSVDPDKGSAELDEDRAGPDKGSAELDEDEVSGDTGSVAGTASDAHDDGSVTGTASDTHGRTDETSPHRAATLRHSPSPAKRRGTTLRRRGGR